MPNPDPQRTADLRSVIADFLKKRLDDKLDKIKGDNDEALAQRRELQRQFVPSAWLADAARRVGQIQAVTHSLKPIHPDAKGTNLYVRPTELAKQNVVGSHCLDGSFFGDVVGNAAALDIYKLLRVTYQDQSLLSLVISRDKDLFAALSDDPDQADAWISAFANLVTQRGRLSSHTLAKQIYWLAGTAADPHNDIDYHLLAPLYASSLAHHIYLAVNNHRFGEGVKEARQARRDGSYSELVLHDYPQMAIQNLGGTKPQNISQLNSERRGDNLLLASLPPIWKSSPVKPLLGNNSLFRRYERRPEVRRLVRLLLTFLASNPASTLETRDRRDGLINALIDELLQFAAEFRTLPPGWSNLPNCYLSVAEKHWLDPKGTAELARDLDQAMPTDSAERICSDFSNWLNAKLRDKLPVGDAEFLRWRNLLLAEIQLDDWEGSYDR